MNEASLERLTAQCVIKRGWGGKSAHRRLPGVPSLNPCGIFEERRRDSPIHHTGQGRENGACISKSIVAFHVRNSKLEISKISLGKISRRA
jgi:hypothetical protein